MPPDIAEGLRASKINKTMEKKLAKIVDIEVEDRVNVNTDKGIDLYGDENQGFSHDGYDGITSKAVREAIGGGEITKKNKAEKLEILLCMCTLDDGNKKSLAFLSMRRKANLTL